MAEPAVRAERSDAVSSRNYYLWEVSGKAVVVKISLELVDRIEHEVVENFRSLNSRGSEIGGILLGNVSGANPWEVTLEDYETVPCDYGRGPLYRLAPGDVERFDHALARPRTGNGLRAVGFFRSHARKALGTC